MRGMETDGEEVDGNGPWTAGRGGPGGRTLPNGKEPSLVGGAIIDALSQPRLFEPTFDHGHGFEHDRFVGTHST